MKDIARQVRQWAEEAQRRGEPTAWFDAVYARAEGDIRRVHWADLVPNPHLVEWLEHHRAPQDARALVVGCGLGDDAEILAARGYRVTAFDISPTAIDMCRSRYPESSVQYVVADLFDHTREWDRAFDLVFECNTIQTFTGQLRSTTRHAITDLTAPGGVCLVSCRSREAGTMEDAFPLPLDRQEMDGFVRDGFVEDAFTAYDDEQDPPVPHFFAVYRRT